VELLPAQSRPRFLLGVAQERSGEPAKAAETFEGAVRLDREDTETLLHLGNLYVQMKRPADAESAFRRVLELQPNEPHALLGLAQSLEAQKKPEAADAYRKYLDAQPSDAATRLRIVHELFDAKEYDAALAELNRTDAGKASLESLKLRADIQIAQKKWDDSIITLQQAVALTPNDAQLHGGLGRVYLQKREFPLAEKELRIAIHLDGKNLLFWKDLSSTFFLGGNYPTALNTLDEIAKVEPPGAGTFFVRAICYDKLNQPKPALEAYQKFLQMDQDKNPDQVWQAQQRSKVLQRMLEQKR
jgi:Flp pilus assembly protein TadD